MTPALTPAQLEKELPATAYQVLHTCFETRQWTKVGEATRSKLVPQSLRQKGYQRFIDLAEPYGIQPRICSCKNPDIPGQLCHPVSSTTAAANRENWLKPHQLSQF